MSGQTVAFVFARGGSKGLPGKNLRDLAGRPLLAHAIADARAAAGIDRVVVSTDDAAIADAARAWGAEVPFLRPPELASDAAPEWLAWQHALDALEGEGPDLARFVSVPATAPLRHPADIEAALARFDRGDVDVVLTVSEAHRNPWFNMVTLDDAGHAALVIPPRGRVERRQAAPAVWDVTTVCYVADPAFLRRAGGLFEGRVGAVVVPRERAVDIDTEFDLRVAESLYDSVKGIRGDG
ncbi:MAG: acylneuraminate cytidylyltransferase family protein [Hyphomicrobiales bacterium]|nr:acylneuraminate cytidylyltransferase family protein [Hyphomicrobiales bacterium]